MEQFPVEIANMCTFMLCHEQSEQEVKQQEVGDFTLRMKTERRLFTLTGWSISFVLNVS